LIDHLVIGAAIVLTRAVCGVVHRWMAYWSAARHDAEGTRRLELLAVGVPPAQRAAILRAYAELEWAARVPQASCTRDQHRGRCSARLTS
jgi:hypothetical protein